MFILSTVVGISLLLTCVLFFVIHPLVCIFHCARSEDHSSGQKALWIIASFFFGILGSLPYALFASGSPRIRSLTVKGVVFGAVNAALFVASIAMIPKASNEDTLASSNHSSESLSFVDQVGSPETLPSTTDALPTKANFASPEQRSHFVSVPEQNNSGVIDVMPELDSGIRFESDAIESDVIVEESNDFASPKASSLTDASSSTPESSSSAENTSLIGSFLGTLVESFGAVRGTPESDRLKDSSNRSTLADELVSVDVSMESNQQDDAVLRIEKLETPKLAKPSQEPKKTLINRYREEGYVPLKLDVPPSPSVRNRYTGR